MIETDTTLDAKDKMLFGKKYKLCSQKIIDRLFKDSKSVKQYPLRIMYILNPEDHEMEVQFQIAIAVPKKNIKKAHERNRIKRVLREQIRLNKKELEQELVKTKTQLVMFLIYSEKTELELGIINKKINNLITQLINGIRND